MITYLCFSGNRWRRCRKCCTLSPFSKFLHWGFLQCIVATAISFLHVPYLLRCVVGQCTSHSSSVPTRRVHVVLEAQPRPMINSGSNQSFRPDLLASIMIMSLSNKVPRMQDYRLLDSSPAQGRAARGPIIPHYALTHMINSYYHYFCRRNTMLRIICTSVTDF